MRRALLALGCLICLFGLVEAQSVNDLLRLNIAPNGSSLSTNDLLKQAAQNGVFYNVKAYGALGDGVTSDLAAINAARDACAATGGVIYFPPGTYLVTGSGVLPKGSNCTWSGAGRYASTITGAIANVVQSTAANVLKDVRFEHLGFAGGTVNLVSITGVYNQRMTFSDCYFDGTAGGNGLNVQGVDGLLVENSDFFGALNGTIGSGIALQRNTRNFIIRNNTFFGVKNGVSISTSSGAEPLELGLIEGNIMDLGWWLGQPDTTNAGTGTSTATAATTLTDSGQSWTTNAFANRVLRVMATKQTGTIASETSYGTRLVDAAANFTGNSVARGDIIRTASAWTVVVSVQDATHLFTEGWRDLSTYKPVNFPGNVAYTIYGVNLGIIASNTATTLTLNAHGWFDMNGTSTTPAATSSYEITFNRGGSSPQPNYAINLDLASRMRVLGNSLKRGWSDHISMFGSYNEVTGNTSEDGQDYGITVNGDHHVINGNTLFHHGSGGISLGASNSIISNITVIDHGWATASPTVVAGVAIRDFGTSTTTGDNNQVSNVRVERVNTTAAQAKYGVYLHTAAESGNRLRNITTINSGTAGLFIGAGATSTVVEGSNFDSITDNGTSTLIITQPPQSGTLVTTGDTGTVTNAMLAGSISLTSKVTGILPYANGGTGTTDPVAPGDFQMREDFPPSSTSSSQVGTHGWLFRTIGGAPTFTYRVSAGSNPGVVRCTTTTSTGQGCNLALDGSGVGMVPPITTLPGVIDWYITAALGATTETRNRLGLVTAATAAVQPVDGVFVRYDTSAGFADSNFMLCRRVGSDTEVCKATATPADTSFHTFHFYSDQATLTTISLTVDGGAAVCLTTTGSACGTHSGGTTTTTFPTVALAPANIVVTDTSVSASKFLDLDYWGLRVKGLSR